MGAWPAAGSSRDEVVRMPQSEPRRSRWDGSGVLLVLVVVLASVVLLALVL